MVVNFITMTPSSEETSRTVPLSSNTGLGTGTSSPPATTAVELVGESLKHRGHQMDKVNEHVRTTPQSNPPPLLLLCQLP